jgi:hypothetical protein
MSERDEDFAARVRAANDIVDVMGAHLTSRPAGGAFECLCPFHGGDTPSLVIDPQTQRFLCRTCGKGGDVLEFVRDFERIPLADAVAMLARRAGIAPERDFAADLALCDAATPGPWFAWVRKVQSGSEPGGEDYGDVGGVRRVPVDRSRRVPVDRSRLLSPEDAAFIAAARAGWPAAIREVLRLRAMYAAPAASRHADQCRFCESRDCHYLIVSAYEFIPFDEVACRDHRRELEALADATLGHAMRNHVSSSGKLYRRAKGGA